MSRRRSQRRDYAGFSEPLVESAILGVELKIAGRSHSCAQIVRVRARISITQPSGFAATLCNFHMIMMTDG